GVSHLFTTLSQELYRSLCKCESVPLQSFFPRVLLSAVIFYLPFLYILKALADKKFDVNGRNRKLKTPIIYPRELSARTFHFNVSKYDDFDYELFAVMIHEGDNCADDASNRWFDKSFQLIV
ncbi:hypothetical protein GCK32_012324, partial [Trichostrongylus colubriformis]